MTILSMSKTMTPQQINELLRSTRNQKFRNRSEQQLIGFNMTAEHVREKYRTGTYTVYAPSSDLLSLYDKCWVTYKKATDENKKNQASIPPSLVYRLRFLEQYPPRGRHQRMCEVLEEQGYGDLLHTMKNTWTKDIYNGTYKWLTTDVAPKQTFELQGDAYDYLQQLHPKKLAGNRINQQIQPHSKENPVLEHMWWIGPMAGWSIIYKENNQ